MCVYGTGYEVMVCCTDLCMDGCAAFVGRVFRCVVLIGRIWMICCTGWYREGHG